MRHQLVWLQCVTIFIPIFNRSVGNLPNAFVEDVSNNLNVTAIAIKFIIEDINSTDVRVIGTETFFRHNFTHLTMKFSHQPITLFNVERIDRQHHIKSTYPVAAVVILFLDKYFLGFFDVLQKFWSKIRRNKMIVVSNDCMTQRTIIDFSAQLWSKEILNFIILNHCKGTVEVLTYFPFGNNKCRMFSDINVIRLGLFDYNSSVEKIQFMSTYRATQGFQTDSNESPFFPDKVPLTFDRCPIKIITGVWPPNVIDLSSTDEAGIEVEFIKTIGNQLNFSVLLEADDSEDMGLKFDPNEEPTGRLGMLKNEVYDLSFGAVPANVNLLKDFDVTDSFLPNDLTFIVPTSELLPSSAILWTVVEKHLTLFVIIVSIVFVISIIINFMHTLFDKTPGRRYFILKIFATLMRSLIETSSPTLPENKTIQWIYGMWFGSSLIISCYFNTTLTSFFTEPGRTKQLKTIQDIVDSKIPISIDNLYLRRTIALSSDTEKKNWRYDQVFTVNPEYGKYFRSKNVESTVPIGLKLTSLGGAATFTDVLRARHISVQWVSCYGESPIYYIGGNDVLSYWNTIAIYRGSPLTERINDVVRRINQSGFWDFQIARYYNRRLIRTTIRQYLIVYNFQHDIDNTKSINQFNEGFSDSLSTSADKANGTEKILLETNEEDIIKRFVRSDKTLVTWDHLSTVFRLWAIGMGIGAMIFVGEIVLFRYMKVTLTSSSAP